MPINDYFVFNGTRSDDMGLLIASDPVSVHPARRGELFPIPGRNGSIVREDGSYDTYTVTYDVLLDSKDKASDVYAHAREVAEWLLGSRGFCRLEDSYEPEYFRLARCAAQMSVENRLARFGRAQIAFEVQPQRYLKSGETPISYEGDSTTIFSITNPTQFEARPLLKFVDTSKQPQPQTIKLTMRNNVLVDWNGEVQKLKDTISQMYRASVAVDVKGYEKAIISGNGYTFLDGNYKPDGKNYKETNKNQRFTNLVKIVPSSAKYIVVSDYGGEYAALQLVAFRPNPGVSAAVINGTTINLDFSKYDTIYLDCDLHDAYYADGSSANSAVSFASNVDDYPTFPGLSPGENHITSGDGENLDFKLVPRWWTL